MNHPAWRGGLRRAGGSGSSGPPFRGGHDPQAAAAGAALPRRLVGSPPISTAPAASLAGLFGLAFGSFANVVIHRVPRSESLVRPGSRCPACGVPTPWYDTLPVAGWLLLRGRCRACQAPISWSYPAVELAMGLLWALVTLRLLAAGPGWAVPPYLPPTFICVVPGVIAPPP